MQGRSVRITVLGSTGSIGVNTLDVIAQHPDRFELFAITANTQVEALAEQALKFSPRYAVMRDEQAAELLRKRLSKHGSETEVLAGAQALETVSAHDQVDAVMAAIVGAAGLLPTLAAVKAGKKVLLANKEVLVMSGAIFMNAVKQSGAELLPIDSEHNAIFQCLPSKHRDGLEQIGVRKIILTASGGPFRDAPIASLKGVTPDQACAHPNWSMGRKISVDSATMMNKGLELIEACWLFNTRSDQIETLVHRQSVIHSMVEYEDGSVLAQLGNPDMRTPIAYGLGWPGRLESGVKSLDLTQIGRLDFEAIDYQRFPCVNLARQAIEVGGTGSTVLNAANEVAVEAFLDERIPYLRIPEIIERVLEQSKLSEVDTLGAVLGADAEARSRAHALV